jgi:hypothetical protein
MEAHTATAGKQKCLSLQGIEFRQSEPKKFSPMIHLVHDIIGRTERLGQISSYSPTSITIHNQ